MHPWLRDICTEVAGGEYILQITVQDTEYEVHITVLLVRNTEYRSVSRDLRCECFYKEVMRNLEYLGFNTRELYLLF